MYVLIPGAGGSAWYWHRLVEELERRGEESVAVQLPTDDDRAGWTEYAQAVLHAIDRRTGLVLVAQSMGAYTAPLVCAQVPVELLILLNAMVPAPGETASDWFTNTQHDQARAEQAARDGRDLVEEDLNRDVFFHDVPPAVFAEAMAAGEPPQSGTPFTQPWPLDRWPDVPTRFLQAREDRFFPVESQRRIVRERLGIDVDEMPGGHLVALSRPVELADRLVAYRAELG